MFILEEYKRDIILQYIIYTYIVKLLHRDLNNFRIDENYRYSNTYILSLQYPSYVSKLQIIYLRQRLNLTMKGANHNTITSHQLQIVI